MAFLCDNPSSPPLTPPPAMLEDAPPPTPTPTPTPTPAKPLWATPVAAVPIAIADTDTDVVDPKNADADADEDKDEDEDAYWWSSSSRGIWMPPRRGGGACGSRGTIENGPTRATMSTSGSASREVRKSATQTLQHGALRSGCGWVGVGGRGSRGCGVAPAGQGKRGC